MEMAIEKPLTPSQHLPLYQPSSSSHQPPDLPSPSPNQQTNPNLITSPPLTSFAPTLPSSSSSSSSPSSSSSSSTSSSLPLRVYGHLLGCLAVTAVIDSFDVSADGEFILLTAGRLGSIYRISQSISLPPPPPLPPPGSSPSSSSSSSSLSSISLPSSPSLHYHFIDHFNSGPTSGLHSSSIRLVRFHPFSSKIFVSSGDDLRLIIWHALSGKMIKILGGNKYFEKRALNGGRIQTKSFKNKKGKKQGEMEKTGEERIDLGHKDVIFDAKFSPISSQSNLLFSASADGSVLRWDWQAGICLDRIAQESSAIRSISLSVIYSSTPSLSSSMSSSSSSTSSDSSIIRLSTGCSDGSVGFWDVSSKRRIGRIEPDSEWKNTHSNNSNSDSRSLDRSDSDNVTVKGTRKGKGIDEILGHDGGRRGAGWRDAQKFHSGSIQNISLSGSSAFIASCSSDATSKLWNVLSLRRETNTLISQTEISSSLNAAYDKSVQLIPFYEREPTLNGTQPPLSMGFSPSLLYTFRHLSTVSHCSFTPDSLFLFTGSDDGVIKLWQCDSGRKLFEIRLPEKIESMQFRRNEEGSLFAAPIKKLGCGHYLGRLYIGSGNRLLIMEFMMTDRPPLTLMPNALGRKDLMQLAVTAYKDQPAQWPLLSSDSTVPASSSLSSSPQPATARGPLSSSALSRLSDYSEDDARFASRQRTSQSILSRSTPPSISLASSSDDFLDALLKSKVYGSGVHRSQLLRNIRSFHFTTAEFLHHLSTSSASNSFSLNVLLSAFSQPPDSCRSLFRSLIAKADLGENLLTMGFLPIKGTQIDQMNGPTQPKEIFTLEDQVENSTNANGTTSVSNGEKRQAADVDKIHSVGLGASDGLFYAKIPGASQSPIQEQTTADMRRMKGKGPVGGGEIIRFDPATQLNLLSHLQSERAVPLSLASTALSHSSHHYPLFSFDDDTEQKQSALYDRRKNEDAETEGTLKLFPPIKESESMGQKQLQKELKIRSQQFEEVKANDEKTKIYRGNVLTLNSTASAITPSHPSASIPSLFDPLLSPTRSNSGFSPAGRRGYFSTIVAKQIVPSGPTSSASSPPSKSESAKLPIDIIKDKLQKSKRAKAQDIAVATSAQTQDNTDGNTEQPKSVSVSAPNVAKQKSIQPRAYIPYDDGDEYSDDDDDGSSLGDDEEDDSDLDDFSSDEDYLATSGVSASPYASLSSHPRRYIQRTREERRDELRRKVKSFQEKKMRPVTLQNLIEKLPLALDKPFFTENMKKLGSLSAREALQMQFLLDDGSNMIATERAERRRVQRNHAIPFSPSNQSSTATLKPLQNSATTEGELEDDIERERLEALSKRNERPSVPLGWRSRLDKKSISGVQFSFDPDQHHTESRSNGNAINGHERKMSRMGMRMFVEEENRNGQSYEDSQKEIERKFQEEIKVLAPLVNFASDANAPPVPTASSVNIEFPILSTSAGRARIKNQTKPPIGPRKRESQHHSSTTATRQSKLVTSSIVSGANGGPGGVRSPSSASGASTPDRLTPTANGGLLASLLSDSPSAAPWTE